MAAPREKRLPRVLFVADIDPSHKFGTFEEQALALGRAFDERSGLFLPLYAAALGSKADAEYRALGLRAECLDLGRFRLPTLARLAALVRAERIEVVHWNFYEPVKNGYLWGLSLLTPAVRHYFTDHISRPSATIPAPGRLRGAGKRLVFRRYEKVFAVSDFVAQSLQAGTPWPNLTRWTHLVNTDRFSPDPAARRELRGRLGVGDQFVALVVGQLIAEKGVDVAIRAIRDVPGGAELWVVGGGEGAPALQGLVERLGVGGRVRFFGVQWDVAPYMRAADCLVCPSRWAEAAGLVNVEALACGLPVVASRIGGIPETVVDGANGALFPPGDDSRLSQILRDLRADPRGLRRLAAAARAAAVDRYSLQNRIDDYLDSYRTARGEPTHADELHATA